MTSNRSVRFSITAGLATLLAVLSLAPARAAGPTAGSAVSARAPQQATWTRQRPAASPSARVNHALAYDIARARVVLFGGFPGQGTTRYDDTWEWNGKTWKDISTGVRPPGRHGAAMAYDPVRARIVLFGGTGGFADTWELDGATWSQSFPTTSPPSLFSPAMTYDVARGRVVMFGGGAGSTNVADTWEWDGTTWTQLLPLSSPPARRLAKMVYDAARDRIVLFGGGSYIGCPGPLTYCPLGDTWEWDGSTWTQRFPTTSPTARATTALTYDSARGRVVLFGGGTNEYGYLGDTWEWDGTDWTQISPLKSPSTRGYTSMAYDAARGQTVLFGGYSGTGGCCLFGETWTYVGAP